MKTININLLQKMIDTGYVAKHKHPEASLFLYNYTSQTQFDKEWNEVTLQCRGLILNECYEIVARPFNKFFNLEEIESTSLPNEKFDVYEKLDGSLGILYWNGDNACIATRGSFTSKQAIKATEILNSKYANILNQLQKDYTYLFEIIYPENRIVLDYGNMEDIILIACIEIDTGLNKDLPSIGFPVVKKYDGLNNLSILRELEQDNKEGFVIQFQSGFRAKVKFEEYLRIHRLVTNVSSRTIWEYLSNGEALNALLDRVPDEFYSWVRNTANELHQRFNEIESICKNEFKELETRKETALYFQTCSHPSILFSMLTKRNYKQLIWKKIRPEYVRPFQQEN